MENRIKYCQYCGHSFTEGDVFCEECGSKISQIPQKEPVNKSNGWMWILILLFLSIIAIQFIISGNLFTNTPEKDQKAIQLSEEWLKQNLDEISTQRNANDTLLTKILINHFLTWEYEVINNNGDTVNVDAIGNINLEIPLLEIAVEGSINIPLLVNITTDQVQQDSEKIPDFNFNIN